MRVINIKVLIAAVITLAAVLVTSFGNGSMTATASPIAPIVVSDEAAVYKKSCAMCHSPKAEKHFDLELTDEHHVKAILDGQKGEKPPHMPAFKDKGIDAEKALALVTYMRSLRAPATE